jgi:hypothetical protein
LELVDQLALLARLEVASVVVVQIVLQVVDKIALVQNK